MLGGIPRGSHNPQAMGLLSMLIVAHIGNSINEYRLLGDRYFPEACPTCGGGRFRRHGQYPHNADEAGPVPIFRFRCNRRGCRQVFAVLPDLFVPRQSAPVAVQEQAVFEYAATVSTCTEAGQSASVSASTVWRWVDRAAGMVEKWVTRLQVWLDMVQPGDYTAVSADESLRPRWQSRRLRKPDKLNRLLLLERLPLLVKKCKKRVAGLLHPDRCELVGGATSLGFCWLALPRLLGNSGT